MEAAAVADERNGPLAHNGLENAARFPQLPQPKPKVSQQPKPRTYHPSRPHLSRAPFWSEEWGPPQLAVVLDVFSRMPLAARVFYSEPSGRDMARLFAAAARRFGPPRHSVSDQGPQFRSEAFRQALGRRAVRHRYGAIGKSGSIALIERFFRNLKTLVQTRARPPLLRADLERRLAGAFDYYARWRPHQGLGGATPAEVFLGQRPAHLDAIPPPRGRPGDPVELTLPFEIRYLDSDHRLPYLVRIAA